MSVFVIDTCRCSGLAFSQILKLAQDGQLQWQTLQSATAAGRLCKHCRPWLKQALATGQCQFVEDSATLRDGPLLYRHFCPDAVE